jgi:hypothetical protein
MSSAAARCESWASPSTTWKSKSSTPSSGFLLEQSGADTELTLAQEAPLGAPLADPPKNDGLVEGLRFKSSIRSDAANSSSRRRRTFRTASQCALRQRVSDCRVRREHAELRDLTTRLR